MDDFNLEAAFGLGNAGGDLLEGTDLDVGLNFKDTSSLLPGLHGDASGLEDGAANTAQPGLSSFSLMGADPGPSGFPAHQQAPQQAPGFAQSSPTGMGSSEVSGAGAAAAQGAGSEPKQGEQGQQGQDTTTTGSNASKRSRQQAAQQELQQDPPKRQSTRLRRKPTSLQDDKPSTPGGQGGGATPREASSGRGARMGMGSGVPAAALLSGDNRMSPAGPGGMPGLAPIAVPPVTDVEAMRMQAGGSREATTPPSISELELKQAYCNSVQALKDYITVTNLLSYDISGKNLPEKITSDLKVLIHHISKVCLQAIKPDTPFVINVIGKDYSSATTIDWELDKSHWINVIGHLQLSDVQVMAILRARAGHVDKLINLYNERAAIARHAGDLATASSMQPHNTRMGIEEHSVMGVLMRHGYLYCARNVVTLHRYMEMLRESLNREQKVVMELFLKVVYQVLSPVQAALFVVESFPYHCDVLALANVLSMAYSRGGGGSSAHHDSSRYNAILNSGSMSMQQNQGDMGMGGAGGSRSNLPGAVSLPFTKQQQQQQQGGNGSGGGAAGGPKMDGLVRLSRFLDSAEVGPGMIPTQGGPMGQVQNNSLGGMGLPHLDPSLGLNMGGMGNQMMGQGVNQMQRQGLNSMNSGQLSSQGMQMAGGSMMVPGSNMLDTRLVSGGNDGMMGNGMGMGMGMGNGGGMQQGNRGMMNNSSGGGGLSMTSSGKLGMHDSLSSLLSKELPGGGEEVQGGGMMGGRTQQMGMPNNSGRVPTPEGFPSSPGRGMNGRSSRGGGNGGTAASLYPSNWASGPQLGDGLSGGFPGALTLDLAMNNPGMNNPGMNNPQGSAGMPGRMSHPGINSMGNGGGGNMPNGNMPGMDFAQQAYRSFNNSAPGGNMPNGNGNGRNGVPGLLSNAGMPTGMDGRLGAGPGMPNTMLGPNGGMGMGDGGFRQQQQPMGGAIMQGLQGMRSNPQMMPMGGGNGRTNSQSLPGTGIPGAGPAITSGGALPSKSSLNMTTSGDLSALWNMVGQPGQGEGMQAGMVQQQQQQQQQQQGGMQQQGMAVPPSGMGQPMGNMSGNLQSSLPVISVPQDTNNMAGTASQGGGSKPEMSAS